MRKQGVPTVTGMNLPIAIDGRLQPEWALSGADIEYPSEAYMNPRMVSNT